MTIEIFAVDQPEQTRRFLADRRLLGSYPLEENYPSVMRKFVGKFPHHIMTHPSQVGQVPRSWESGNFQLSSSQNLSDVREHCGKHWCLTFKGRSNITAPHALRGRRGLPDLQYRFGVSPKLLTTALWMCVVIQLMAPITNVYSQDQRPFYPDSSSTNLLQFISLVRGKAKAIESSNGMRLGFRSSSASGGVSKGFPS